MHVLRSMLVLLVPLALVVAPAEPARAADTIVTASATSAGAIDVVATVPSDVRTLGIQLVPSGGGHDDGGPIVKRARPSAGSVRVKLDSWGFGPGTRVRVYDCRGGCLVSPFLAETTVDPIQATPEITWPEVTRVGPGDPPYTVSTQDPGGGGILKACFNGCTRLASDARTDVAFASGTNKIGQVEVLRCSTDGRVCTSTGEKSPALEVRISLSVRVSFEPWTVGPGPDRRPDLDLEIWTEDPGEYLLDWWIEGRDVGESSIPVEVTSAGLTLPVDLTGLRSGTHQVRVRLTRTYPGFDPISGVTLMDGSWTAVTVDATPPGGRLEMSGHVLAPHRDRYLDDLRLDVRTERTARFVIDLRDGAGRTLRSFRGYANLGTEVTWAGRLGDGRTIRPGSYTLHTTVSDGHENTAVLPVESLRVTSDRLVSRTFRRTVTPAATTVDRSVGRCSRLQAGPRGWKGGWGFYTNTRCDGDFDASLVATTHALRVPKALQYGDLRISAFGGGARIQPGSYLFLDQLSSRRRWGKKDVRLHYRSGEHPGKVRPGVDYVHDDRRVIWEVYTYGGAAYDLRSFTITLEYNELVRR